MAEPLRMGTVVVSVLNGRVGRVIEQYHHSTTPYYRDYRVWFADGKYWIVRERHLRSPIPGEIRIESRARRVLRAALKKGSAVQESER